jgi:integrase/recombinase XerD
MSIDLKPTCPVATRFWHDLKLSGASPRTQQSYVRAVRKFTEFLGHAPDLATEDQLRNYLLYLVDSKQWQPSTINVAQQALKRFFCVTCPKDWAVLKLARVQVEQKLPVVISNRVDFQPQQLLCPGVGVNTHLPSEVQGVDETLRLAGPD